MGEMDLPFLISFQLLPVATAVESEPVSKGGSDANARFIREIGECPYVDPIVTLLVRLRRPAAGE